MIKPDTTVQEILSLYNLTLDDLLDWLENNKKDVIETSGEGMDSIMDTTGEELQQVASHYSKLLRKWS
jgi:hypothetical protein